MRIYFVVHPLTHSPPVSVATISRKASKAPLCRVHGEKRATAKDSLPALEHQTRHTHTCFGDPPTDALMSCIGLGVVDATDPSCKSASIETNSVDLQNCPFNRDGFGSNWTYCSGSIGASCPFLPEFLLIDTFSCVRSID